MLSSEFMVPSLLAKTLPEIFKTDSGLSFSNSKKNLLNQIMNVKIINSTNFALECQIQ